jgi:hypothetical protein
LALPKELHNRRSIENNHLESRNSRMS